MQDKIEYIESKKEEKVKSKRMIFCEREREREKHVDSQISPTLSQTSTNRSSAQLVFHPDTETQALTHV